MNRTFIAGWTLNVIPDDSGPRPPRPPVEPPVQPPAQPPTEPPGPIEPPVVEPGTPRPNNPGNSLIPSENGYLEIGPDGVPLGEWVWCDEELIWIFDPIVPMAVLDIPQTDATGAIPFNLLLFGLSFMTLLGLLSRRKVQ